MNHKLLINFSDLPMVNIRFELLSFIHTHRDTHLRTQTQNLFIQIKFELLMD